MVKQFDDYIYLFAAIDTVAPGIKVARVLESNLTDRSLVSYSCQSFIESCLLTYKQYTYWNGRKWVSTPPAPLDARANMFNYSGDFEHGPASGNIYFNTYCIFTLRRVIPSPGLTVETDNTWMAIFFDGFVDGTFRLMYSETADLVGPWSKGQDLYQTTESGGYYNYAGHAYPDIGNGRWTLLTWTYAMNLTMMANVTFG